MKTTLPTINLGKIKLREIEESDYLDLYECGKSSLMCETLNWGPFERLFDAKFVMKEIYLKRPLDGIPKGYAIIYQDKMIGMVDYHTYNKNDNSIEIGYFLNPDYWGMGIMTKALKETIKIGFNHLDVDKIRIGSETTNVRSIKLIERLKLKYEETTVSEYKDKNHLCLYYSIYKYEYKGDI
ncbi:MAG: GNAT family N-acetyltransferase [Acholeplasmatales bacterium]|nr:GNAT family N-acetyltransferase [Acholeplasmatales bacterium]